MRKILAVLMFALAACGGDTGPAMGSVRFTRDGNTCSGTPFVFTFFADGNTLGSATLAAGASQDYPVSAGSHSFSVRATNTTITFANVVGVVPENGTFRYLMVC